MHMMASSPSSHEFSMLHHEPELVVPAEPTPLEAKHLSDIDDQEGLRMHLCFIMFYKENPALEGKNPSKVIKEAMAKALVYYYPLAGRIREEANRKLVVDCNSEGILFVEAEADISLEKLGDTIRPPCPYMKQFLYQLPGSDAILGCPLLLIQVTRFKCGGFVFAVQMNHAICDAFGLIQFLNVVASLVRSPHTSIQPPVWQRDIFNARSPPRVTCSHHEYSHNVNPSLMNSIINNDILHQSFFFGPKEIQSLRNHVPEQLKKSSTFEILSACLWKCRTMAFEFNPNETVGISCFITAHGKIKIPKGYYGNAFVFPTALSKAGLLCQNPLGYALDLIKKTKAKMNEEYIRSVADLMVLKGRPMYNRTVRDFYVGDLTRVGFHEVDFGWGNPIYGGPVGAIPCVSYLARFKTCNGEEGIVAPILLPLPVMKRFLSELVKMTTEERVNYSDKERARGTRSML